MIKEITDKILSLAKIECPKCGSPMSLKNFSQAEEMFRCSHCNSIFLGEGSLNKNAGITFSPRPEISIPKKISISQSDGFYIITRKWFGAKYFFFLFFATFWSIFMITWNSISITSGAYIMVLFGLLHTAVGVFVAYLALTGFVNKTDIKLGRGKIIVKHYPLWWPGSKEYSAGEFIQFYSMEKIQRGKNGTTYSYELFGKTHSGTQIKLISGLETSSQALFFEQKIENYLGIKDEAVSGEIFR